MATALEFLRHILPAEGLKCATIFSSTSKYNKHFTSCEDLVGFISTQDALGHTAYHACASFKTNSSRKQDNVLVCKALWIDCDTKESHADATYADVPAAWAAVEDFCRRTGLPAPTYVASGYGLHAYWVLVQALDLETWQAVAIRLKRLCDRMGLVIDKVRTADASSILRTPGTHNRKLGDEVLVQVGDLTGPYRLEELGELANGMDVRRVWDQVGSRAAPNRMPQRSLFAAAGNIYGEEPSDPDVVADQCTQLGYIRTNPASVSEPRWYAAIGVLQDCDDGYEWARKWVAPDWHAVLDQKFNHRAEFTGGPTTCAHFENINPKGCAGCPHKGKITSPIQLGRLSAVAHGAPSDDWGHAAQSETVSKVNGFPAVPPGFALNYNGLFFQTERNQTPVQDLISSQPIYLDSVQTGEITSDSFSLCFKLHLPKEEVRDITLPTKTMFSSHGMSELAGKGAVIHDPELFKKYVRDAMDNWHKENKLQMRYDQFGWKNDDAAFLYGGNLYTATSVSPISGSDEVKARSQYLGPSRSGSLSRWSSAANALFTKGCEPQSFALLASFAAPLMRFHSAGEGGAIVSLVSDQSGSGKTTALEAVASVWGRLKGTQLTDDDTRVAKGLTLGVLGNIPCVFDELYNRDPEEIRKFVLAFTNGRDKMRGTVDGGLRHSKAEWQTILVLASNQSIVDVLESMDGTDAPAFRLLEFVTSFPESMEKRGDDLKRELAANSGWAADAYLRTLLQPETLSYVKKALPEWTDSIWKRTALRDEHRFWVRCLASVVAAGVIVRHAGILDFSVQRILDWAVDELQSRAGDATVTGRRHSASVLADFFNTFFHSQLVMPCAWRPHAMIRPLIVPKNGLVIRYEVDSKRAWILESELRKFLVKKGVNRSAFMKELKGMNVVRWEGAQRRVTLGAGTDFASGQATVIEINMNHPIMSGVVAAVNNLVPTGPVNTRAERIAAHDR